MAVHLPIDRERQLQQITEYVGDTYTGAKRGRKAGRVFPAQSGIIGKALREKATFIARRTFPDYESFIREMMTEWNYTELDARELNPAVNSWLAIPILSVDDVVEAVLYVDSNGLEFFTQERVDLLLDFSRNKRYIRPMQTKAESERGELWVQRDPPAGGQAACGGERQPGEVVSKPGAVVEVRRVSISSAVRESMAKALSGRAHSPA